MSRSFRVLATIGAGACVGFALLARAPAPRAAPRTPAVERQALAPPVRLRVPLDALERAGPGPSELTRNPFRFHAQTAAFSTSTREDAAGALQPPMRVFQPDPPASTDPPMPWKLTATVQRGSTRWAVFSDCRGIPMTVKQGDSLAGEWTVTAIGIESATLRALDGRVTTVPLVGCRLP